MMRPNVPTGWAGFRALRQAPAPVRPVRHGNWKHGLRSKSYPRERREFLWACRALDVALGRRRGRALSRMPAELLDVWCPPLAEGWAGFRRLRGRT